MMERHELLGGDLFGHRASQIRVTGVRIVVHRLHVCKQGIFVNRLTVTAPDEVDSLGPQGFDKPVSRNAAELRLVITEDVVQTST